MIFYYTNSPEANQPQPVASKSIGGFVSSSVVPNDVLNEVFSGISMNTEDNKQYRLLALRNTMQTTAENLMLKFFLNEDAISSFEVALVAPATDKCGDFVFEQIASQYSKPFTGDFTPIADGSVLSAGDLEAGQVLGIWLCREFKVENNPAKSCEELCEDYDNQVVVEKEDELQLDVCWDDAESVSVSASASVSESASESAS